MTTPAPETLTWTAKSLVSSSKTTREYQTGTLDLSSNKMFSHQLVPLPDATTSDEVAAATAPAMLFHIHIVSDRVVIFRIKETTGGGEIDLEGKVLLLSAGQATTGLNVLWVKVVNLSGAEAMLDVFYAKGTA